MPRLNLDALADALDARRQERDMSWRAVARHLGLATTTLTRIRDGARPDVDTLLTVTGWLEAPVEDFACGTCGNGAVAASVTGATDLPVADRDREWDGDEARRRVFEACTDADGNVDVACVSRAFLWRDDDADEETQSAYSLGFADVIDDTLTIVPRGVAATAGGRGVDALEGVSDEDRDRIESRICSLYDRVRETFDDWPECPFETGDSTGEAVAAAAGNGVQVEGVVTIEGTATGDGRLIEAGALTWDVLPIPIIWDRDNGDHTGMTVGLIDTLERRGDGMIWGAGSLSASDDEDTQAAILRVQELLEEGAVGVSVALDDVSYEVRVSQELWERWQELDDGDAELEPPADEEGRRVIIAENSGDWLEVTTSARVRHLAVVDTPAHAEAALAVAASGSLALSDRWEQYAEFFDDPGFGQPGQDDRLRFDPQHGRWSVPVTVTDDGRVFGHVAPIGLCLRGRPDSCVTPPDGDLDGFMRHYAPAAGGRRTGVIQVGGSHSATGIGIAAATQHYDKTGRATADVRVGKDAYGTWFSGMLRPGVTPEDIYALQASDVSGHWEIDSRGRPVLVGLPAVNVGGFPKGYLTWQEVQSGLAASGTVETEPDDTLTAMARKIDMIAEAVTPLFAERMAAVLDDDD